MMNPPPSFSNNSLFIGDLSKFCSESNLESLFAPFGQIVDVKIKRNNATGKTLSYGFVSFANDECAVAAMEQLNGYSFYGRNLRIRWAVHNAKAQKAPEESVINSVYVRFITPKTSEYVTEEAFHKVFDHFGCVVDVSIKESSVDQRTNRQSGYGFVHFSADSAGIAAAFQAVSAVDNSTVDGVTYNVELSKNLLKQFNELQKGQSEEHAAPTQGRGGMNPHAPAFNNNAAQHWAAPSNNTPYPPNKYAPAGGHHRTGSGNGSGNYPQAVAGMMYQQQHLPPPQHSAYAPMGQQQHLRGPAPHPAANPHMHAYMNATAGHSNNNMYASQGMQYGNPYGDSYQQRAPDPMDYLSAAPHQQGHLPSTGHMQGPYSGYRIGAPSNINTGSSYGQQVYEGNQLGNQLGNQSNQHGDQRAGGMSSSVLGGSQSTSPHALSPLAHSPAQGSFILEAERSAFPLTSGSANSPFPNRSHSVSPVPGRSPRAEDSLNHGHHGGYHSRQASGSLARSLTDSLIEDGLLMNADNMSHISHGSHYSPRSGGAISPMYESDSAGHSGSSSLVGKPPPLNLSAISGLTSHPHYSANNSVGGGSSVNSVAGGSSAGTSPIPTGRGGLLERMNSGNGVMKVGSSPSHYWEGDVTNAAFRGEKPPTPVGNKAVGTPTMSARHQQGQIGVSSASCSSGSTSQDSTPTNAYAHNKYGPAIANTNSHSPKNMGVAGYPIGAGLAPGIGSALPPPGSAPNRSGMHSRSSSTSSATASTGLYTTSGTGSPSPYYQNVTGLPTAVNMNMPSSTSSGALNSARKPNGLTDLDVAYGVNRSMSSSASDRNLHTLSTMGTTDTEGSTFFGSASSSFLADNLSPSQRREQAVLASQIMLSNLTAAPLTNDQLELHKQLYDLSLQQPQLSPSSAAAQAGYFGQQGNHRNYRKDKSGEDPQGITASRPVLLQAAGKQISLQSVSSIGEDAAEDYLEDEFTYSAATSATMTPKHLSGAGSFNLGDSGSFRLDTSFMLSPQNSDQSMENSPFGNLAGDASRGRPPSGATPLGLNGAGVHPNTATAVARRSGQTDGAASGAVAVDEEGSELEAFKDSRPVSMNSINSNDSSQLAGIAISSSSTSSEWDGVQGGAMPEKKRPEGIRISKTPAGTSAAVAAALNKQQVPGSAEKADAAAEEVKPKSRQLSLTQFFKPAPKPAAVAAAALDPTSV